MSAPPLTDAAVHRMIRRILTAHGTNSDSVLALADGLAEAAAWTDRNDAAAFLADHAAALRKLAPCFADRPRGTPLEAALMLASHHGLTEADVAPLLERVRDGSPLAAILHALLTAAETIRDAAERSAGA